MKIHFVTIVGLNTRGVTAIPMTKIGAPKLLPNKD